MFSIRFIVNGLLIDYKIGLDLGTFLAVDYKRKVVFEQLSVNEAPIFTRENG